MPRFLIRNMGFSLRFDGIDDKVETTLWLASASGYSFGCWFKSTNYRKTEQVIISNGNGAAGAPRGLGIVLSGNSTTDGSMFIINQNIIWKSLNFKVTDNDWHHIWINVDSTSAVTPFLDGIQKTQVTGISPVLATPNTNSLVATDGGSRFFQGNIDEIMLFNSLLPAAQVSDVVFKGRCSLTPLNWYKHDEGSGSTTNDSGSSPKNGTITGATYTTDVKLKPRTLIT